MTPAEQLRDRLARERAAGRPFAAAWEAALDALPAPAPGAPAADVREAEGWRAAIAATRPAWRRAYLRAPATRAERAAGRLAAERAFRGVPLPDSHVERSRALREAIARELARRPAATNRELGHAVGCCHGVAGEHRRVLAGLPRRGAA